MERGTLQRRQRRRKRLNDFKIWLICTSSVGLFAFAATWGWIKPFLKQQLSDYVARRINWYAFVLDHGGINALRHLEPGTLLTLGSPPDSQRATSTLIYHNVVENLSRKAAVHQLVRSLSIKGVELVDGGFLLVPSGYWLQFPLRDRPGQFVWIYHDQGMIQVDLWRIWLLCVTGFSLLLGNLIYLRLHLVAPLSAALETLPLGSTRNMLLLPESGGLLSRRVCIQLNRFLAALNECNNAQRSLLRGLTHDLRSPLGRIKLRSEQLVLGLVPEHEIDQDVAALNYDINQLSLIIDKLHAYADNLIDQQDQTYEVQLSDIIAQVVATYINSSVTADVERIAVRLNPLALKRSLNNLIDNALEYGAPPVLVSARLNHGWIVIKVEDHGQGLLCQSQLLMPRMPAASDRHEAAHRGLGLGIVEQFCNAHGGSLRLGRSACGGLMAEIRILPAPTP